MLFGKKKLIGLDIGSSSIKLAELDVSRKSATLVSFGMLPSPPQAMNAGEIVDPQGMAVAIRQLVSEVKTKRKLVATGLWGSSVVVKKITIPRMEEKLVAEQIRWEAEQYIPYNINEVNLEFKVLKTKDAKSETMDVLIVAAVQASIFKCAEVIELSGLSCSILDVEGFAVANCYEKNYGDTGGSAVALLNIGASVTSFVVVYNSDVVFCRDIPVGGNTYTTEIQKALNISFEEAEGMKLGVSAGQPTPAEVSSIIQSTHEIISDELNSSVEFFQNTSADLPLKKCLMTGGAIRTPGLQQQISKVLACEMMDPLKNIKYSKRTFTDDYLAQIRDYCAVAIGLGIRSLGDA